MKLKFFTLIFMLVMLNAVSALAQKYEVSVDENVRKLVITTYQDQILVDVLCIENEQNSGFIQFEAEKDDFRTYLLYDDKIEAVKAEKATADKQPQENDYEKSYPDIYEKEKDANRSIIIVESVASKFENGENYTSIKSLFLGKEREFLISSDVKIENVPENYGYLKGEDITALKKGDIIKLTAAFSGEIEKVSLIFRPPAKNPVFTDSDFGDGFSKLFSNNSTVAGDSTYKVSTPNTGLIRQGYGYAYGVIKSYKNFELELCDIQGNVLNIDVADGAFVYVCDIEEKLRISNSTIGAIRKGAGVKSAFSEDESFVGWQEGKSLNYAFVRTISGQATEVVIYKNY